jgi:hypothetical protein
MHTWLGAVLIGSAMVAANDAAAHGFTLQECFEGGDFIVNAAKGRDNGIRKDVFLDKLVADVALIQAFPPQLRWFVADPTDAEFLYEESARVFDEPQPPEQHRAQFLDRCFNRMAPAS